MAHARANPFELSPGARALLAHCREGDVVVRPGVWKSGALLFHSALVSELSAFGWIQATEPYITEAGRVRLALSEGLAIPDVALGIEQVKSGWWVTARWPAGDACQIGLVAFFPDVVSGSRAVRGYNDDFRQQ